MALLRWRIRQVAGVTYCGNFSENSVMLLHRQNANMFLIFDSSQDLGGIEVFFKTFLSQYVYCPSPAMQCDTVHHQYLK